MNKILFELIKNFEGCKLTSYQDQGGKWTIGYGCIGYGIEKGTVWSQDRADRELIARMQDAEQSIFKISPIMDSQNESKQAAIADFIYNCGSNAYRNSHLKISIDQGHWQEAASQLMQWNHIKVKESKWLTRRRAAERSLLITN